MIKSPLFLLFYIFTEIQYLGAKEKQRTVAHYSSKAEYYVVASIVKELNWVQYLLCKLHVTLPSSLVLYYDNIGAT